METAITYYNHYVGVHIIYALNQLGYLQKFDGEYTIDTNNDKVIYLIDKATKLGITEINDNKISLTEIGLSLKKNIGFFTWIVGGYSDLLKELPQIATGNDTSTSSLVNGKFVAQGSDECNKSFMSEILDELLRSYSFKYVADLGCGNAGRLIRLMHLNPSAKGIGIDISDGAIMAAKENVLKANLGERIKLKLSNVFSEVSDSSNGFPEVDTVMCFMMFHDLLNINIGNKSIFNYLFRSFPDAETFIIADTVKSKTTSTDQIFTLGFELIHYFQDIRLFDLEYYIKYFEDAELMIQHVIPFGVPNTYIFILKRKKNEL